MNSPATRWALSLLFATALAGGAAGRALAQALPEQAARDSFDISVSQLHEWAQHKDFVLVNVHIPYAGEIPGTDLKVPFDRVTENLDKLPADRTAKLVVYCRSGSMSAEAKKTLRGLGYERVYNVVGGMNAWTGAGYPLEQHGGS